MKSSLIVLYRFRLTLRAMIIQGLRDRIAASAFGAVYLLLYPIVFLGVYSVVFIQILNVRVPDLSQETYTLLIFCGLVPFLAFAEALSIGTGSIVSNAKLVKNFMFPYELLPMRDVLASYAAMSPGYLLLLCAAVWAAGPSWTQVLLPLVVVIQAAFTVGLVWITSALNVFFRDLQKMMPVVILFLMMVSPIAYTRSMLSPNLEWITALNPLATYIHIYREILFFDAFPLTEIIGMTALSAVIFLIGFAFVRRLRPMVFDFV